MAKKPGRGEPPKEPPKRGELKRFPGVRAPQQAEGPEGNDNLSPRRRRAAAPGQEELPTKPSVAEVFDAVERGMRSCEIVLPISSAIAAQVVSALRARHPGEPSSELIKEFDRLIKMETQYLACLTTGMIFGPNAANILHRFRPEH